MTAKIATPFLGLAALAISAMVAAQPPGNAPTSADPLPRPGSARAVDGPGTLSPDRGAALFVNAMTGYFGIAYVRGDRIHVERPEVPAGCEANTFFANWHDESTIEFVIPGLVGGDNNKTILQRSTDGTWRWKC
jgi:hypothetical protein